MNLFWHHFSLVVLGWRMESFPEDVASRKEVVEKAVEETGSEMLSVKVAL